MNPEFERNLWLELTRRRLIQMAVVLTLIFLTINMGGKPSVLWESAQALFYGIVAIWGTREAARAVVGEIRDRTWDFQRLSALTPFEMTWGKLLGATSYVWFGGVICLAVLLAAKPASSVTASLADLFFYLSIGLAAQAAALFASLVAIRRRQTHTRLNVFQYQMAGLLAGWLVWSAWQPVTRDGYSALHVDSVQWWNMALDARGFVLVSLAAFLCWIFTGCYRLMRLELQMRNRPAVWCGFLAFMALYAAGFGRNPMEKVALFDDPLAIRLALACATLVWLTYVPLLFEPKDRVLYRWLGEMVTKRRWPDVASRLQCWMISYGAAMILGLLLALRLDLVAVPGAAFGAMIVAGMGFLTRDCGIVLYFGLAPGQKRGDMPAVVTLGVLYLLAPQFLSGLGATAPDLFLFPQREAGWIGIAAAWAEAVLVWGAVAARRMRSIQPLRK